MNHATAERGSHERDRVEILGHRLVVFVVLAALVGTWIVRDRPLVAAERVVLVVASLAYLALAWRSRPLAARSFGLYCFAQLACTGAILFVFGRAGAFGTAWLLAMPPVAEATLVLAAPWAAVVAVTALGLVEMQAWLHGGWPAVAQTVLPLGLALAFVVLFTRLARREAVARARSEALGRELAEANRHLERYAAQAEALATERERSRLAGEIHDGLGHVLTVAAVQIEASLATLDDQPEDAREALERAAELTRQGLREVRRAVTAFRASPVEGRSLGEALGELASASRGVAVRSTVRGEPRALAPAVQHTLYRAAQEGITNVHKHARASRAEIELDFRPADAVRLTVADDGEGPGDAAGDAPAPGADGGYGLWSVERRVRRLGGSMSVGPAEGGGTVLRLEVPA